MNAIQVVILNGCLRQQDSEMLQHIDKTFPVLFLLVAIGGPHKQQFDKCMAHHLPIPILSVSQKDIPAIARLCNRFTDCLIFSQSMQETDGFVETLKTRLNNVEHQMFQDSLAVPFALFTPVFSLFNTRVKNKVQQASGRSLNPDYKTPQLPVQLRNKKVKKCSQARGGQRDACYPTAAEVFARFKEQVEHGYSKSRQLFGDLFNYSPPSSSFMSPYISAGCVTIRQLYHVSSSSDYKQELVWNQYCMCYLKRFGQSALKEYGPYDRKRRWCSEAKQRQIIRDLFNYSTEEPLINCVMKQLIETGFVPNRLRMVFASWLSQQGIPWKLSASIFENWLIDYDYRSNVFNWLFCYNLTSGNQHTFSIKRQIQKFDPKQQYIKKWSNTQSNL